VLSPLQKKTEFFIGQNVKCKSKGMDAADAEYERMEQLQYGPLVFHLYRTAGMSG